MKISENLQILIESLDRRKPISFKYVKPGKIQDERIGNVYAVFRLRANSPIEEAKVHLIQTAGASESREKSPFPCFRTFDVKYVESIQILNGMPEFEIDRSLYNSNWDGYKYAMAKQ